MSEVFADHSSRGPIPAAPPRVIDLGCMSYADAFELQLGHHAEVLAAREAGEPDAGRILLVEHTPPVITMTRRPNVSSHLVASQEVLGRLGVTVAETDRGGDITYHGPGQLVVYPILDLNLYRLGLHDYMRLLEASVGFTVRQFGLSPERDPAATGVWLPTASRAAASTDPGIELKDAHDLPFAPDQSNAKVCAMGVRVRRWVSMHGLALNVSTNLSHFQLIVPCGLAGRPVTSLQQMLGDRCPSMPHVKSLLAGEIVARLQARLAQ